MTRLSGTLRRVYRISSTYQEHGQTYTVVRTYTLQEYEEGIEKCSNYDELITYFDRKQSEGQATDKNFFHVTSRVQFPRKIYHSYVSSMNYN